MLSLESEDISIPLGRTLNVADGQSNMIKSLNLKHRDNAYSKSGVLNVSLQLSIENPSPNSSPFGKGRGERGATQSHASFFRLSRTGERTEVRAWRLFVPP